MLERMNVMGLQALSEEKHYWRAEYRWIRQAIYSNRAVMKYLLELIAAWAAQRQVLLLWVILLFYVFGALATPTFTTDDKTQRIVTKYRCCIFSAIFSSCFHFVIHDYFSFFSPLLTGHSFLFHVFLSLLIFVVLSMLAVICTTYWITTS